jgi:hypothetical protein
MCVWRRLGVRHKRLGVVKGVWRRGEARRLKNIGTNNEFSGRISDSELKLSTFEAGQLPMHIHLELKHTYVSKLLCLSHRSVDGHNHPSLPLDHHL